MAKCILFIDGENFLHKIRDVLKQEGSSKTREDLPTISLEVLFKDALKDFKISGKKFYSSKIHSHQETLKKSEELIKLQRKMRNALVNQGCEYIIAGNVRGQKVGKEIVFSEKGVDVRIAVDLISLACDKAIETAIICSSDSDLQPAIKELKDRKIQVVYLGFENSPNKGLSFTANRTILLRNYEVIESLK